MEYSHHNIINGNYKRYAVVKIKDVPIIRDIEEAESSYDGKLYLINHKLVLIQKYAIDGEPILNAISCNNDNGREVFIRYDKAMELGKTLDVAVIVPYFKEYKDISDSRKKRLSYENSLFFCEGYLSFCEEGVRWRRLKSKNVTLSSVYTWKKEIKNEKEVPC